MDVDIRVLADAPPSGAVTATKKESWVQLAKQGAYKDPRYGSFKITAADFGKWLANFAAMWAPPERKGIPVDVDHGPEKRGETEAAGWITRLEQRGKELWGMVEWNDLGIELVSSGRYAYLSPSYAHDFKDEEGRSHGTAMVGVGLTNRPFLRMATVTLSAEPLVATEVAEERGIASGDMALLDDLRERLASKGIALAADATEADALTALDGLAVPEQPADTRTLTAQLQAEGMVVMSATDHSTLLSQASNGQRAADELHRQKFEGAFDKALSEGRVTPAQRDDFEAAYQAHSEGTLKILDGLPKTVSLAAAGHSGAEGDVDFSGSAADARAERNELDEDRARVDIKAQQLMAANQGLDYLSAAQQAARELGVTL